MSQTRQWPSIDILQLYAKSNTEKWNAWLTRCLLREDVVELQKTRYGIQAGLSDIAKQNLNTEEVITWFIRAQRSIDLTVKKIYRKKYPSLLDSPRVSAKFDKESREFKEHQKIKRKRDAAYEQYLKSIRF